METYNKVCLVLFIAILTGDHNGALAVPFPCGEVEACNIDVEEQFCSQTFRMCRPCEEIRDDCGKQQQPVNCTSYCLKYFLQKSLAEERAKHCNIPPYLRFGRIEGPTNVTQYYKGTTLSITCEEGYSLKGASSMTCLHGGQWDFITHPECIPKAKYCNIPPNVRFGRIEGPRNITQYSNGTTLFITCEEGYIMNGASTMTCLQDGQWDVVKLPECKTKETHCNFPPSLSYGSIESPQYITQYSNGTTLSITCEEGYILTSASSITCLRGGNWGVITYPQCTAKGDKDIWRMTSITVSAICGCQLIAIVFLCKCRHNLKSKDAKSVNVDEEQLKMITVSDSEYIIEQRITEHNLHINDNNGMNRNRKSGSISSASSGRQSPNGLIFDDPDNVRHNLIGPTGSMVNHTQGTHVFNINNANINSIITDASTVKVPVNTSEEDNNPTAKKNDAAPHPILETGVTINAKQEENRPSKSADNS